MGHPLNLQYMGWCGLVVFVAAIIFDVNQHRIESTLLQKFSDEQLKGELAKAGFISRVPQDVSKH